MKQYHDNLMEGIKAKLIIGIVVAVILALCFGLSGCSQKDKEQEFTISIVVKTADPFTGVSIDTETEKVKCKGDKAAFKSGLNKYYAMKLTRTMLANKGVESTREAMGFAVYNKAGIDVKTLLDGAVADSMEQQMIMLVDKEATKN